MTVLAEMEPRLHAGLLRLGIDVSADQLDLLERYLQELARWNQTYNLTAIRDVGEMVVRHVLDSASIHTLVEGHRVLDVGTGGGLPGVVLAILNPDRQVTLLDSAGKKVRFLRHIRRELKLDSIEPVQARAENYEAHPFDTITARAWTSLAEIVSKAGRLCTQGGMVLAMKGVYPQNELDEVMKGFTLEAVHPLMVPGLDAQRHAVILRRAGEDE